MELVLFNTETREKEPLKPIQKGVVTLYTCGPTVYNFAHIGNFRTYIFEDLLRRTIQYFGFKVNQVMNLTDVDDKTIRGATQKGVTLNEYCAPYIKAFFDDLQTLNIQRAEHYPAATDFIPQMVEFIQKLLDKGIAYQGKDGSIYYNIRRFPRYGCLSHLKLDELKEGASDRINTDEYDKDNIADFVLWKGYDATRDGSIFWESPFGKGRPGWHLECSTMAMQILGDTIDIHVGGVDNMFPHHENEIAQSEACSGKRFVNLWLHAEHLLVDNRKMSKSLGNFYTLRDLLNKGFRGSQIRYMLLQTHYKTQLNFTLQGLDAAKISLQRIDSLIDRLQRVESTALGNKEEFKRLLAYAEGTFKESLGDDLNIARALAVLFDLLRDLNTQIDEKKINKSQSEEALALLRRFDSVLGVMTFEAQDGVPADVQSLFEKRLQARREKNWALSDTLRDEITAKGFAIEDSPIGSRVKRL